MADFLLVVHFLWAAWMVLGVILALAGFHWPCLWDWRWFRIAHLAGMAGTATVPVWADGLCPLTVWERRFRPGDDPRPASFLVEWLQNLLYLDVPAGLLTAATVMAAGVTLVIFVRHPPGRKSKGRRLTVE